MGGQALKKLVGVVGGSVGSDPFDRRCWSGSSYSIFNQIRIRGRLHRAFGVEVPRAQKLLLMLKAFRPDRKVWRKRFYSDPAYHRALTEEVRRHLESGDFGHEFFQIGGMYDVPSLVRGRTRCFSYSDSNLAEALRSPYLEGALDPRSRERALADERDVYGKMDLVFTFSEYMRGSFIRDYRLAPERVVCIGGGMNLETYPEPVPDKPYDTREVLFIGIEFRRKGGWQLLDAFRAVRGAMPGAKLHIVGPRALTIPPDREAGVEYHGFLDRSGPTGRAAMDDLFRRCCLFVMPSLYEPFGIAPLEAMLHQIPCLVTDGWALPEMVLPGKTGDLAACGDAEDLAEKMSALLSDPEALRRMGEYGRRRVLEQFTWERVADRLFQAIDR